MDDVTTTVTEQNFCQRLSSSFGQLCVGILLVPIVIVVIFWNETDCVKTYSTADLIKGAVVVSDCAAFPSNNEKLVYVSGCQLTTDHLGGDLPHILQQFVPDGLMATKIGWSVEMLQWVRECETHSQTVKTNTGGTRTVTTETCEDKTKWLSEPGAPSTENHNNVGSFPWNVPKDGSFSAQASDTYLSSKVGDETNSFFLNEELIQYFPSFNPLVFTGTEPPTPAWNYSGNLLAGQLHVNDGSLQTGNNIGDIKITITAWGCEASKGCVANVAAVQTAGISGTTFKAYAPQSYNLFGQKTYALQRLEAGSSETEQEFISSFKNQALIKVYVIRIICIVVMCCAWNLIFSPLSVMSDLVMLLNYCTCCLGSVIDQASQTVIGCVSCSISLVCFSIFFALAWCVARPVYSVLALVIIAVVGVGLGFAFQYSKKKADARSVTTPYVKLRHAEKILPQIV
jgi:hypothetical protein